MLSVCYLWKAVGLLELRNGVGSHIISHLFPRLYGSLHQPLARNNTQLIKQKDEAADTG